MLYKYNVCADGQSLISSCFPATAYRMSVPQGMITGNNLIFNGGTYIQNVVPQEAARDLIVQEDRTVARTQARISTSSFYTDLVHYLKSHY